MGNEQKTYTEINYDLVYGDDFNKMFQFTNNGVPLDITGFSIKIGIKKNANDLTTIIPIQNAILTTPLTGIYNIYLPKTLLFPTLLLNSTYYYSIEVTDLALITKTRQKGIIKVTWEGA